MTVRRRVGSLAAIVLASVALSASAASGTPGNGSLVTWSQGRLFALDPETGSERDLGPGSGAAWSPDGTRIAFVDGGAVSLMNPDGSGRRRLGNGSGDGRPVWSPDGGQLAFVNARPGGAALVVANAETGVRRELAHGVWALWPPAWSPDGTQLAYTRANGAGDLAVVAADGTGDRLLSSGPMLEGAPAWSPDGSQIAFFRGTPVGPALHLVASAGGPVRRLAQTTFFGAVASGVPPAWSPDGTRIAFTGTTKLEYYRYGMTELTDVFLVDTEGLLERRLTAARWYLSNRSPIWSPDGRRLAFESQRDGGVYVMNADGTCETRIGERLASSLAWQPLPLAPASPRIRCADLELTVPNARGSVAAGGDERFQLSVLNLETETATGVRLTAGSFDGGDLVSASSPHAECAITSGALSCELGSLAVGESTQVELVVRAQALGLVRSRAVVSATEPDGNRSNNVSALTFEALPCELVGTAERDDLIGTDGRDTVCALAGADRIRGLGGADAIDAGGGPDRVDPGRGRDTVELRAGDDVVDSRDGERDTIACGGEHDVALVDRFDVTDRNCDVVIRSQLRCSRLGTLRADEIVGTERKDSICALAGNDTVRADKGADAVDGGGGNDTLTGGRGRDLLLGGAGYDTIQARDGERDRVRCGPNFDVVLADKADDVARDCERVSR